MLVTFHKTPKNTIPSVSIELCTSLVSLLTFEILSVLISWPKMDI